MIPTLRTYQQKSVDDIRQAFRDRFNSVLLVSPTGSGKTTEFAYITESARRKGTRIAIVVHRVELLRQTTKALDTFECPYGVIHPDYAPSNELVQVGTVQTMIRRFSDPFDLLVLDEAHHAVAGSWDKLMAAHPKARILGVTATPCRLTGKGLGNVFDKMIMGPSVRELTDAGYLSPATVYAPPIPVEFKRLASRAGDYKREDLERLIDRREIYGSVIEHYRKYLNGQPSIAFCPSVPSAIHAAEQFNAAGFSAAAVYGSMPSVEREERMSSLQAGCLSVLASCDLISEGVDCPGAIGGVMLRKTKSTGLWLQQVGRCLRISPGKTQAIILDHVGNSLMHGLPDMDREWTLEDGLVQRATKKDDGPKIRQCPRCYFVHLWATSCQKCGYTYEVKARKLAKEAAGELVLVSKEEGDRMFQEAMKIKAYGERLRAMHRVAKSTGKSSGWAWVMATKKASQNRALARIEEAV